jgi:hypothetical protein
MNANIFLGDEPIVIPKSMNATQIRILGVCAEKIQEVIDKEDFLEGSVDVRLDTDDVAVLNALEAHCNSESVGLKADYSLDGEGAIFTVEPKVV